MSLEAQDLDMIRAVLLTIIACMSAAVSAADEIRLQCRVYRSTYFTDQATAKYIFGFFSHDVVDKEIGFTYNNQKQSLEVDKVYTDMGILSIFDTYVREDEIKSIWFINKNRIDFGKFAPPKEDFLLEAYINRYDLGLKLIMVGPNQSAYAVGSGQCHQRSL
jgi:hypothetical protein